MKTAFGNGGGFFEPDGHQLRFDWLYAGKSAPRDAYHFLNLKGF
ncbi:MAG: hypothetical protein RBR87_00565 [Bacteroidales bacterium]|jgi:hypothetical protein|nr:hypothetical protein [Bacteroidales bacterium]